MSDPLTPAQLSPEELAEYRKRQKNRNRALGAVLVFFVVLFYAITFVRIGAQHQ
ncbi:hypothetical protein [Novosphingobium sp. Gsoil 351]|uniref:hypothetical protein n=1 Tax=Novosphingobium sp. Gsoil 351 TaxID=2675225 RepID=UPI0018A8779E|nr:hypothetical protein [Novosphingobium sp. Gsoil 351]